MLRIELRKAFVLSFCGSPNSYSGVPSSTMIPSAINITRSATSLANPISSSSFCCVSLSILPTVLSFPGEETSPHVYIFYRFTTYTKSGNGVHMAPLPLFNIPTPAFAQIHPLAGACQTHIPVLYHSQAFPDSQAAELSQRPPQLTFSRAGL